MDSVSQGGNDHEEEQPPPPPPDVSTVSAAAGGGENMEEREAEAAAISPLPKAAEARTTPTFMGKHRLAASVTQLNQQIQFIEEELEELETFGESSLVCKQLVATVESVPDALLPITKGPAVASWDRWFQGAHGSRSRKRWI